MILFGEEAGYPPGVSWGLVALCFLISAVAVWFAHFDLFPELSLWSVHFGAYALSSL